MGSPRQNSNLEKIKAVNEENSLVLGRAFWNLVRLYNFDRSEQALLLGIKNTRSRLNDLEKEDRIPVENDVFFRVGTLLGIHKNLRLLFPYNRDLVYKWMKTEQPLLNNQIPIDYIKAEPIHSMARLFSIRRLLDQVRVR